MNHIVEEIGKIGIVPVIALEDAADADNLARALEEGGLPCAEVTFRTKAAKEAIRIMADSHPDLLVGAGTVLTVQQAQEAHKAGAKFIVSPGLNPKVVRWCTENGIPVIPGCCCPSDIEAAMELGLDTVKFFPAEAAGDFNQSLIELGAIICVPNGEPRCGICPVKEICLAHMEGRETEFPVKKKKKERRIEKRTVLVFRDNEKTAVRKRAASGLLAGLYEFPGKEGHLKQAREEALECKSMKAISQVFEIYKTKCEQYLNSNGRDWKQLFRDYVNKRKAEKAAQKAKEAKK